MERVLIVDDDPDIQRLVSYNLTQAGFEVTSPLIANVRKRFGPDKPLSDVCRRIRKP